METKKIFARLGVTMTLTEEEFALLCEGEGKAAAMVKAKLDRREYAIDGETYFPGSIEERDGEWFHEYDIEFNF